MFDNYALFKEKAEEVSAFVKNFETINDALKYTVDICVNKNSIEKKKIS